MTMFARTRVAVLDPATERSVDLCGGPRHDGSCSAPVAQAFGCGGRAIVAEPAGERRRVRLVVPGRLDACPLAPSVAGARSHASRGVSMVGHPWAG
jgi:hypothetical protein